MPTHRTPPSLSFPSSPYATIPAGSLLGASINAPNVNPSMISQGVPAPTPYDDDGYDDFGEDRRDVEVRALRRKLFDAMAKVRQLEYELARERPGMVGDRLVQALAPQAEFYTDTTLMMEQVRVELMPVTAAVKVPHADLYDPRARVHTIAMLADKLARMIGNEIAKQWIDASLKQKLPPKSGRW